MRRSLKLAVGVLAAPLALGALAAVWLAANAEGPPSALQALRAHLATAPRSAHEGIVGAALAREGDLPWRSGETLTFLAQAAEGVEPRLVGDFNGWPPPVGGGNGWPPPAGGALGAGRMERLGGSSWYALEATVLPRARIEYLIAHEERLGLDPHNPHHLPGVGGEVSEVRLPGCRIVPELAATSLAAVGGRLVSEERRDGLGKVRRVSIYTPAGYRPASGPYPLVVFHDGSLMLESGGLVRVLDWLIENGRVAPLVAVFVDPAERAADYALDEGWRSWFVDDLLADVERRFAVERDPARRAVIGVSRGAVGAVDLLRSERAGFGFCGLLIPATQPVPVVEALRARPLPSPLRVTAVLALHDAHWLDDGRRLVDALRARGATVDVVEAPEGHGVETWRRHVGLVLERFAPGQHAAR